MSRPLRMLTVSGLYITNPPPKKVITKLRESAVRDETSSLSGSFTMPRALTALPATFSSTSVSSHIIVMFPAGPLIAAAAALKAATTAASGSGGQSGQAVTLKTSLTSVGSSTLFSTSSR